MSELVSPCHERLDTLIVTSFFLYPENRNEVHYRSVGYRDGEWVDKWGKKPIAWLDISEFDTRKTIGEGVAMGHRNSNYKFASEVDKAFFELEKKLKDVPIRK